MATSATTSQGTILNVTISGTPTPIPGVSGLVGPHTDWTFDETTNLASPGNFKERVPIMKDGGTVTWDMVWDPANAAQAYLRTKNLAGTLEVFSEIFPDTGSYTVAYSAYIAKFDFKAETGKALRVAVELIVTGAITDTP